MKNLKKISAIIVVIFLLIIFVLPMIFAFGNGDMARSMFQISIGMVFIIPVMAYMLLLAYRVWGNKKKPVHEIENIIFDVGKVLVEYDWETLLKSYNFSKEKYDRLSEVIFKNNIWEERDSGILSEEEYVQKMIDCAPEYAEDIKDIMRRTGETIKCMDYSETWVKYLKAQGYNLYILSNYCEYMYEQTYRTEMPFLKYMDGTVFSYTTGDIKPNESIYYILLNRYGLKPEKCVFIDDRIANCKAANKVGIHTIQFESFKQATLELKKYNIL